jgi:hypothetical protein
VKDEASSIAPHEAVIGNDGRITFFSRLASILTASCFQIR